eukprot:g78361.t1
MAQNFFAQLATAQAAQHGTLVLPIALRTESWGLAWPITNDSFERALSTHRALTIVLMLPATLRPDTNSDFIADELDRILTLLFNKRVYNDFLTYLSRLCALLRHGCVYECQYAETQPPYEVPELSSSIRNYEQNLQARVAGLVSENTRVDASGLGQMLFCQRLLDPLYLVQNYTLCDPASLPLDSDFMLRAWVFTV